MSILYNKYYRDGDYGNLYKIWEVFKVVKVKFLGTAAAEGWPALFCECESCKRAQALGGKNIRTRSSCLIDDVYMVDFPPDTYMHRLVHNLDLSKLEHLFITHSHSDHFYANDLAMRLNGFAHIEGGVALKIYGNDKVKGLFDNILEDSDTENIIEYNLVETFHTFKAGDAIVTALPADHAKGEDCYIYVIRIDGKTLLYGHDSGYFPEETWERLVEYKFDGVILDCTFGPRDWRSGHMGLPANVDIKDRLLKYNAADENTQFIVTHFSHNMKLMHHEMEEIAKSHGFITAYDGMEIEI